MPTRKQIQAAKKRWEAEQRSDRELRQLEHHLMRQQGQFPPMPAKLVNDEAKAEWSSSYDPNVDYEDAFRSAMSQPPRNDGTER